MLIFFDHLEHPDDHPLLCLPSSTQGGPSNDGFTHFAQFPQEIRDHIWDISVRDYPARIIDLREYRRPASEAVSTGGVLFASSSITGSSSGDVRSQENTNDTRDMTGFKSRVPAPTLLYACADSRRVAKKLYTKAFSTVDMPAETWIDFEKDILYLTLDFCYLALENLPMKQKVQTRFQTGRKEPHGYFLREELGQDIRKVKDLAISGIWTMASGDPYRECSDVRVINQRFINLERITLVDNQHAPELTGNLAFAKESPSISILAQDPCNHYLLSFREDMFHAIYAGDDKVWHGLKPYPWFEYGTIVERQPNCVTSCIRPRKSGSRLATDEDRQRAVPDPQDRVWRGMSTEWEIVGSTEIGWD